MKRVLTNVLIGLSGLFFAQNVENTALTNFARINLGLHGLEVSYEVPIARQFVWENSLGVGMGSSVSENSVDYLFDLAIPTPFIKSELKFIYNTKKRISNGKGILNNSGHYIGLQTKYSFGNVNYYTLNRTLLTEIHWGIQTNLGKRFLFNWHIGFGYIMDYDTQNAMFSPTLGLRFGYKLF